MCYDDEIFQQSLTLFHLFSEQNNETVRQLCSRKILPPSLDEDFFILDIGAGEGYLPRLMKQYSENLVLLEPNQRCLKILNNDFDHVYPYKWNEFSSRLLMDDFPGGFSLITMSHMLYHFDGINDIRNKLLLAMDILRSDGYLVITINKESAPTANLGMKFLLNEGKVQEFSTNAELHKYCHDVYFYKEIFGEQAEIEINTIDTPLKDVNTREELVTLFRMPLLNPLSKDRNDVHKLDEFISRELDTMYPNLQFPVTLSSEDDIIIIKKAAN